LVDRQDEGVGSREKFVSSKSIDEPGGEASLMNGIQSVYLLLIKNPKTINKFGTLTEIVDVVCIL
jgi:hypothetical protein